MHFEYPLRIVRAFAGLPVLIPHHFSAMQTINHHAAAYPTWLSGQTDTVRLPQRGWMQRNPLT